MKRKKNLNSYPHYVKTGPNITTLSSTQQTNNQHPASTPKTPTEITTFKFKEHHKHQIEIKNKIIKETNNKIKVYLIKVRVDGRRMILSEQDKS